MKRKDDERKTLLISAVVFETSAPIVVSWNKLFVFAISNDITKYKKRNTHKYGKLKR